jgi:hypothetical protein
LIESFLLANKLPHGFDCPGCAFPDKPGKPLVDSCEQGQKAIAWEMTRKAVGAEFFDGRTPTELQALGRFRPGVPGSADHARGLRETHRALPRDRLARGL